MATLVVVKSSLHVELAHASSEQICEPDVLAALELQGLTDVRSECWPGGRLYWCPAVHDEPALESFWRCADGFVACVGFLNYAGRRGQSALEQLWKDFRTPEKLDQDELYGNYLLVIRRGSQVWMFGDRIGLVRVYSTRDGQFLSNSWMVCAHCCERPLVNRLAVADYVFNGANHGPHTLIDQIRALDPDYAVELISGAQQRLSTPAGWLDGAPPANLEQALQTTTELLIARLGHLAGGHHQGIRTALSGGFDSRLILAALLAADVRPDLFVYGRPSDEDVIIAREAAASVEQAIQLLDKSQLVPQLSQLDMAQVVQNARFFDGIPTDGLFDSGADRATRLLSPKKGALQLNGGGGEIFRNFFYLADRSYSPADLVRTFYHPFKRSALVRPTDYEDYFEMIETGICHAVGAGDRLTRQQVDLVYPLFRVRYWTSNNNSIAASLGDFYTPLVDPPLVKLTSQLPVQWKDFGRFESKLIDRLNPSLGAIRMDYGFSPQSGPSQRYITKMSLQNLRPPRLRAMTGSLKRLAGLTQAPAIDSGFIAAVGTDTEIRSILDPAGLMDIGQVQRAYSVQALIRLFSIRMI